MKGHAATLAAFLPRSLTDLLAVGDGVPWAPAAMQTDGVVLLADIRGFTRLTMERAEEGAIGPELVRELLDACFGGIIDAVTRRGGDVVDFAGDAVLALWRAEGGARDAALEAARACGLDIHEVLSASEVTVRVGVAAGPVCLMRVGGHDDRFAFLVCGPPFSETGRAAREAPPRGVGGPAPAGPAGRPLELRVSPLSDLPEQDLVARLASYLPEVVLQRVEAGQWAWLSELRQLSVVFVILRGLDGRLERDRKVVQDAVLALQQALAHHDGELNQVLEDDTGYVLLAALGLPPRAHEDDAARATRVALAMHDALDGAGVAHGIGVATGRAFCGAYGNDTRRRYALVGDLVNLAARLAQQELDSVSCDEATAQIAARHVRFELLGEVALKGRGAAERRFRPFASGRLAVVPEVSRAGVVGRDKELAALLAHLVEVQPGAPAEPAVVVGEAGIGKTTVVGAVIAAARARGVPCLMGVGEAVEQGTSWYALRPAIAEVLGVDLDAPLALRRAAAAAAVEALPGMSAWLPLLAAVLPLDLEATPTTERMTGPVRSGALRELLVLAFQRACAVNPRLLILDDAHWSDASSWELVADLVERVAGLRVLVVTRPVDRAAQDALRRVLNASGVLHLNLGRLPRGAIEELVTATLGAPVPEPALDLIEGKSEGNPLFARELALALRDRGLLVREEYAWRIERSAGRLVDVDVPDTIQGLVTQRLDRFTPLELLALKVGAVLGRTFELAELTGIYPVVEDRPQLADTLAGLAALGVVRVTREAPGLEYAFDHSVFQDAAYALLPFAQRRQLHELAARWLEAHPRTDVRSGWSVLAFHWEAAGDVARALDCLEKAGDLAILDGANREAIEHFSDALDLHDSTTADPVRVAHWHGQLGDAWYALGQLEPSQRHIGLALVLLRLPMPRTLVGWGVRALVEVARQGLLLALPRWLRPRPSERSAFRLKRAAQLVSMLGEQYYFAVQLPRMIVAEVLAVNLAERAGAAEVASRPYGALGYLVGLGRLHRLARLYFRRARRGREARASANAHVAEALYHMAFGDFAQALRTVEDGLQVTRAVGDQFSQALLVNVRADVEHCATTPDVALASYEELVALSRAQHNTQHEIWGLTGAAETLVSLGRVGAAEERLQAVRARLDQADTLSVVRFWGVWATVAERLGRQDDAEHAVDRFLEALRKHPEPMYSYVWALAGAARAARDLATTSKDPAAPERAKRALKALKDFARIFPFARTASMGERGWWKEDPLARGRERRAL